MTQITRTYLPSWLGFFLGIAAIAAGMVAGADFSERWQLASRYTAQVSYPIFLLTFVASSLVRLFPNSWTKALMRSRRYWGLGFAACFFVHLLALLVYNYHIDQFPPTGLLDRGLWAYALLLAMVLTSTDTSRTRFGKWWKRLHRLGMWVFMLIFVVAFYLDALFAGRAPDFDPFAEPYTLSGVAALCIKFAAWSKTRNRRSGSRL